VGSFVRVPGRIGPATGPLTVGLARLNRVRAYHSCRKITAALIPEELLSIGERMIGAETECSSAAACCSENTLQLIHSSMRPKNVFIFQGGQSAGHVGLTGEWNTPIVRGPERTGPPCSLQKLNRQPLLME
jgi:hypothetical protein